MANVQAVHDPLPIAYVHRAYVSRTVELTTVVRTSKNALPINVEYLRFIYPGFYGFHNHEKMISFIFMVNQQGLGEVAYIANSIPVV